MAAAVYGHSEVVALVADRGANINAQGNVRETKDIYYMHVYMYSMYYIFLCRQVLF